MQYLLQLNAKCVSKHIWRLTAGGILYCSSSTIRTHNHQELHFKVCGVTIQHFTLENWIYSSSTSNTVNLQHTFQGMSVNTAHMSYALTMHP